MDEREVGAGRALAPLDAKACFVIRSVHPLQVNAIRKVRRGRQVAWGCCRSRDRQQGCSRHPGVSSRDAGGRTHSHGLRRDVEGLDGRARRDCDASGHSGDGCITV